jgi:YHS domain-containing protein
MTTQQTGDFMYKTIVNASGLASLLLVSALTLPTVVLAADENNVVPGLTAVGAPLGLHGVDPVAAIEIGNPVDGAARYAAVYNGVSYYFSSEVNLKTFKRNPESYVPQNGGFCTFGASKGKKFDGDPQYASIVDGKLYVFLNEEVFKLYLKDKQGTIKAAANNWKRIRSIAATEL